MTQRASLTREDWIHSAQRALVKGGVDAVSVDTLAKELKITRGSFYYHFKSRGELLESILTSWRVRSTEDVITQLRNNKVPPRAQLEHLINMPHHEEAAAIELSIRAWARKDPKVRHSIDEVDGHRLAYIESLLLQLGLSEGEAKDRAYLIYAYQLSLCMIQADTVVRDSEGRNQRMTQLLVP